MPNSPQRRSSIRPPNTARVESASEPFETAEPPIAAELGIATDGPPPARTRLVGFVKWVQVLQDRLDALQTGRGVFLQSIGIPAITGRTLKDIVEKDKSRFLEWMPTGAKLSKPSVREFERDRLREKLKADTYEAAVARDALAEADVEIDILTRQIEILEKRCSGFVKVALIEHAIAAGADYVDAIKALDEKLAVLLGLASIAGAVGDLYLEGGNGRFYRNVAATAEFQVNLPRFGLCSVPDGFDAVTGQPGLGKGRPEVAVSGADVERAAAPWKALLALWTSGWRLDSTTGAS